MCIAKTRFCVAHVKLDSGGNCGMATFIIFVETCAEISLCQTLSESQNYYSSSSMFRRLQIRCQFYKYVLCRRLIILILQAGTFSWRLCYHCLARSIGFGASTPLNSDLLSKMTFKGIRVRAIIQQIPIHAHSIFYWEGETYHSISTSKLKNGEGGQLPRILKQFDLLIQYI